MGGLATLLLRARYGGPSYPSWGPTMEGLAPLLGGIMGGPPSTKGPPPRAPRGGPSRVLPSSLIETLLSSPFILLRVPIPPEKSSS